jgi:hypothetical protein
MSSTVRYIVEVQDDGSSEWWAVLSTMTEKAAQKCVSEWRNISAEEKYWTAIRIVKTITTHEVLCEN